MDIFEIIEVAKRILDQVDFARFLAELYGTRNAQQQIDVARKYRVIK